MAYSRFTDSDAYVYESIETKTDPVIVCAACSIPQKKTYLNFETTSRYEMISHLLTHIERGDHIHKSAIMKLIDELIEEVATPSDYEIKIQKEYKEWNNKRYFEPEQKKPKVRMATFTGVVNEHSLQDKPA